MNTGEGRTDDWGLRGQVLNADTTEHLPTVGRVSGVAVSVYK
jgi:hypothetical protein